MLKKATVASAILIGSTLAEQQESLGEIMGLTDEQLAESGLNVFEGLEAEDLLAEADEASDSDSDKDVQADSDDEVQADSSDESDDDLAEDDSDDEEEAQELAEEEYATPEALDYFAEIYPNHSDEQILASLTEADKAEWGFFKKVFKKSRRFFKKTVRKARGFVKKTYRRVRKGAKRVWGRVKKVAKKVGHRVIRGVSKFA